MVIFDFEENKQNIFKNKKEFSYYRIVCKCMLFVICTAVKPQFPTVNKALLGPPSPLLRQLDTSGISLPSYGSALKTKFISPAKPASPARKTFQDEMIQQQQQHSPGRLLRAFSSQNLINPSNAKATFVHCTRTQRSLKTI